MPKRKTQKEFIEDCVKKHGNQFDYSKVNYINSRTKVCIVCPEHGEFFISPDVFLRTKYGCPKCSGLSRMTKDEFIEKAKKIHGDKYDYSKAVYSGNNKTKICIICPEHGEFWMTPNCHLNGQGCPKCGHLRKGKTYKLSTKIFIEKAKKIHGDKYDYSKVNYESNGKKVCIICPKHGEFWITPHNHIGNQHQGCPKCGNIIKSISHLKTKDEFIKNARKIHGEKYDYSKVEYINNHTKVCIICPKHGEFWQTPNGHLGGCGCPHCNESKLEIEVEKFLNKNNFKYISQFRIDWLGKQSLDFYLPDYSIAIECQGGQHFYPIDFFGGKKQFKRQIKNDTIKKQLCKQHNIRILYYSNLHEKNTIINLNDLKKEILNE